MSTNYTGIFSKQLYECIQTCQKTYNILHAASKQNNESLDVQTRNTCVQAARKCVESCSQTIDACSAYLMYITEAHIINLCQEVVEKCNICIKNCRKIIEQCDTIDKHCFDTVTIELPIFTDCIETCRRCAENRDL